MLSRLLETINSNSDEQVIEELRKELLDDTPFLIVKVDMKKKGVFFQLLRNITVKEFEHYLYPIKEILEKYKLTGFAFVDTIHMYRVLPHEINQSIQHLPEHEDKRESLESRSD